MAPRLTVQKIFHGTNLTDRLKPAATLLGLTDRAISGVLARAPVRGNTPNRKKPARVLAGNPIFSSQTYGRGRSFAMSTDSTMAWGTDFERSWGEGDNRYFRKFWRNVVRWLAENSNSAEQRLELTTDKVIYRPGQPIDVRARAFDEKREPTNQYRLTARLIATNPEEPATDPSTPMMTMGDSRDFSASLTTPTASQIRAGGEQSVRPARVEVVAWDGDQVVARSNREVQVLDDSEEYRDPRPDLQRLESLARATGGSILGDAREMARLLEPSTASADRIALSKSPIWDGPATLMVVFGLLATEWVVRRLKSLA